MRISTAITCTLEQLKAAIRREPVDRHPEESRAGFPPMAFYRTLGMAAAFLLPLKLSLAYIALLPVLAVFLVECVRRRRLLGYCGEHGFLLAFLGIAFVSCFAGLSPAKSLPDLLSLAFFSLTLFFYSYVSLGSGITLFGLPLVLGQAVAALHSVIDNAADKGVGRWFLGEVTESGQLGLVIFVTLALVSRFSGERKVLRPAALLIGLHTAAYIVLAFSPQLHLAPLECLALAVPLLLLPFLVLRSQRFDLLFPCIALPLLLAALVVNLKRGPWAGVSLGLGVFAFFQSPIFVLPLMTGGAAILLTVRPVWDRIAGSISDFMISGGRLSIWQIGFELLPHYPLGIGLGNSPILRKFSAEIPPELTHFHSNLLNIGVETGWLGATAFVTWCLCLFRLPLQAKGTASYLTALCLALALFSWQVAGIVEYNVGDSEVLLIAFLTCGLLSTSVRSVKIP